MPNRWFKRRWEESRSDEFTFWGAATYYFELGEDGWPSRQVQVYDHGPTLRYGPEHEEDEYGQLGQAQVEELEDWAAWAISSEDFEQAWSAQDSLIG